MPQLQLSAVRTTPYNKLSFLGLSIDSAMVLITTHAQERTGGLQLELGSNFAFHVTLWIGLPFLVADVLVRSPQP